MLRGELRLTSADPAAPVKINANIMHHPDHIAGQMRAVTLAYVFLSTRALKHEIKTLFFPQAVHGCKREPAKILSL